MPYAEIIVDSSCLHATNPANERSGTGSYNRVSIFTGRGEEATIVFQGEEWDQDNFEEKMRRQGRGGVEDRDPVERVWLKSVHIPLEQVMGDGGRSSVHAIAALLEAVGADGVQGGKFLRVQVVDSVDGGDIFASKE